MCGIAGIYRLDGREPSYQLLETMARHLQHRGPDDSGVYLDGSLGLAFRRLAILDLSPAGHQPMCTAGNAQVLVFNGEIYNYGALRADLEARGHVFRSTSDTEVLLAGYAEWGERCFERLSGMWALAIWDARRKRLVCARDRFGIKPFYYHRNRERFVFASEIKALFVDGATPNRANERRLHDYLVFGYLDHTPETCFEEIFQIPPAHYMIVEQGQAPQLQNYWALDPQRRLQLSAGQAAEQCRDLLTRSVRAHLQSDVPVGTCLSGGLDSSSLVCLISQALQAGGLERAELGTRQKTFSACYEDPGCDERPFIDAVIARTGAANYRTFPDDAGLAADLERLVWHQEEPSGSTSVYAQWCVMRLAHAEGVTVLLDGQGGDEVLAGYHTYFGTFFAGLLRGGRVALLQQELAAYRRRHGRSGVPLLRAALGAALPGPARRALRKIAPRKQPAWLGQRLHRPEYAWPDPGSPFGDPLGRQLHEFLMSSNLPSLLHYEDRNSMAFSIEARVPFLDPQLVEFLFALPGEYKLRDGQTKAVLRDALRDILPTEVHGRQDKLGFATPEAGWLRGALKPVIEEAFASRSFRSRGYSDAPALDAAWQRLQAGDAGASKIVWRAFNLELWLRRFVDRYPLSTN